jgi:hypothetical protein
MLILKEIQKDLRTGMEARGLHGVRLAGYQHAVDDLRMYPHLDRLSARLADLRRQRRVRRRQYVVLAAHEGVPREVEEALLFLEGSIQGYAHVLRAMTDYLNEDTEAEEPEPFSFLDDGDIL